MMLREEPTRGSNPDVAKFYFHLQRAQEYANRDNWHSVTDELEKAINVSRRMEGKPDAEG